MLRDKLRDKEYFDSYIEGVEKTINLASNDLASGSIKEDRIPSVVNWLYYSKLRRIIAKYSRGDDIVLLKIDFIDFLEGFFKLDNTEFFSYSKNLEIISLAVLLNIPLELRGKIGNSITEKDSLTNFLAFGKSEDLSAEYLSFPNGWQLLFDVTLNSNKIQQELSLINYINDVWAKRKEEEGEFESHKNMSMNSYYGYWCFEAGAIAKILKIPDNELKENQYYPYDLVHFTK